MALSRGAVALSFHQILIMLGHAEAMLPAHHHKIRDFCGSANGGVMLVFALVFPVALSLIGMSVDYGKWLDQRATLQSTADAAALAGALAYRDGFDEAAAKKAASGVVDAHELSDAEPGYAMAEGGFRVTLQKRGVKYFSGVVPTDPPMLKATAVAAVPEEEGGALEIRLIK